ncbi:MAG: hypothetical protein KBD14_00300 [Candidatus Pacebacteria bacterium]|nr:hypothetical protein [Candidatus Paceibacterota bacterium]
MKKIIFLFFATFFCFPIFSQTLASAEETEKTEEKIEPSHHNDELGLHFNVFFGLSGTKSNSEKDLKILGGADMYLLFTKTYHYFTFDLVNNEISSTNGYKWNDNLGSYVFVSYGLNKIHELEFENSFHEKTLSLGIEYFFSLKEKEPLEVILFTELGKGFAQKNETFFGLGIIAELDLKKILKK